MDPVKGARYLAECDLYCLEIVLLSDETDFDGTFSAMCCDTGETLRINGWLWSFEPMEG